MQPLEKKEDPPGETRVSDASVTKDAPTAWTRLAAFRVYLEGGAWGLIGWLALLGLRQQARAEEVAAFAAESLSATCRRGLE